MSSIWNNSIDKKFFLADNLPSSLNKLLITVYDRHYEELYEPEATRTNCLQDDLDEILGLFNKNSSQILKQFRYIWMALILAFAVEPTVKYYLPDYNISEDTINQLSSWLKKTIFKLIHKETNFNKVLEQIEFIDSSDNLDKSLDLDNIFSEDKKIPSFQVIYEALDVYKNAVEVLDPNQSLEALLNILDDCLEGYAIFPGSHGRRELFDWWLLEVVPASWTISVPRYMYTINDSVEERSPISGQMARLQEIMTEMLSIMSNLNSKKTFPPNISPHFSLKSFEINVKTQNKSAFNSIKWT
jgi:hypothetical protein